MPAAASPVGSDHRAAELLRRMELTITRRLDGILQGDHLGLVPGLGSEQGETRPYVAGDDVRRIDWNVTARSLVPHVRETVADRELETWILVDRSPSLEFGTVELTKRELALRAVAAVGFLTGHSANRLGAVVASPTGARVHPARSGRAHLLALLHLLAPDPPAASGTTTDLGVAIRRLLVPPRRRGLAVIVSDFLSTPGWEGAVRALAARHQVLAIEIVDPRELELPAVGILTLVDPETGRQREVETSAKVRARYAAAAAAQRDGIAAALRGAGAAHVVLRTDQDWVGALLAHVARSRRIRAVR